MFDGELTQHVHVPTGARHYHVDASFEDSAFLMAFLTPAPDSSGLTHVLEHLVMCGSERFPCRRAFFAMLGRTLSTTMNAMTTEDCTAYHFATRNLADYENLLSVYVDAAFFPRLDRLDFDQEGCRVEFETEGGKENAPVRRGVVLSEMRGLMSEPGQQLEQALNRSLFPCAPYRFNAGGDPWAIPGLDHETLKAYHRRHYDPANAVFLSAGPWRPEWLHGRLGDLVLGRFSCREAHCVPGPASFEVPPLEAPTRSVVHYPAAGAGDREPAGASVALAWRLGETSDPMAGVRARLLARCLLEPGDAPLHRALLETSGSPAVAFGSNAVQATGRRLAFRCGVHGCDPELAGEIEAGVLAAIDGAARDGLDRAHVEGALASMERELRERHDPRFPYPLKLLTRILPVALYAGEPAAALDLSAALAALRNEIRSRRDVAELVRRCLRDNPERVSVTAIPDPAAARRLDAEDRAALIRAYGPSRRQARRRVIERSRALRRRQESDSGESSLPRLGLDEVGPARERPELYTLPAGSAPWRIRHRRAGTETAETGSPAETGRPSRSSGSGRSRHCGGDGWCTAGRSRGRAARPGQSRSCRRAGLRAPCRRHPRLRDRAARRCRSARRDPVGVRSRPTRARRDPGASRADLRPPRGGALDAGPRRARAGCNRHRRAPGGTAGLGAGAGGRRGRAPARAGGCALRCPIRRGRTGGCREGARATPG